MTTLSTFLNSSYNGYTGSKGDIGFTGSQGIQGDIGFTGSQGIQGDIGFTGSAGEGVAVGGTTGQVLSKISNIDYDAAWSETVNPGDVLDAAFSAAVDDDGTQSSGTYTPSIAAGSNYKKIVNGGAFTLAPPSLNNNVATTLSLFITNNASAGAITTSGFTQVVGDGFSVTDGDDFLCRIEVFDIGGTEYSFLNVVALQ